MKKRFGSRWAYHLQGQIMAEELNGVTYPSFSAAERDWILCIRRRIAMDRAERLIQELPATLTVLLHQDSS
ncbi:MAG: hypothetical protein ABSF34_13865 [Verrucomicrobiota bacterium]